MNTASLDNLTGTTIGQFALRERLGAGGMGVVYSAFQANLQRTVAVKLLPPALAMQEGYMERFTREARTAASLEHAHIVPVYDYGTHGDLSYVVMRLLTGGTLAERIRTRSGALPSLGEVATLLNQIASALGYAHSKGIIHRDIKAGNIMFDNQGSAFLVDFGIAKLLDDAGLTNSGLAMGTPTHMSPEQWRGESVTPASDQYALAVVIYEVAAGRLPFETNTAFALMNKHLNEMPTPLPVLRPDVPKAVAAVLDRALAKEPDARYPTVVDFAQEFERAVKGAEGQSTDMFTFVLSRKPPATQDINAAAARLAAPTADLPKTDPPDKFDDFDLDWLETPTAKASPEELELIKRTVEKRIKKRREFFSHVAIYFVINAMLWIAFGGAWWLIFPLFGWGVGVISHAIETFYEAEAGSRRHEREMARELARRGYDPALAGQISLEAAKKKRKQKSSADKAYKTMNVSAEGELIPIHKPGMSSESDDEDEQHEHRAARRNRR